MSRIHVERWGIGTHDWCVLGFVEGVFYVWRFGVSFSPYGSRRRTRWVVGDVQIIRLWPFVIVDGR